MEQQQFNLSLTSKELEHLKYALNCAALHASDVGLADFAFELELLWSRVYNLRKNV